MRTTARNTGFGLITGLLVLFLSCPLKSQVLGDPVLQRAPIISLGGGTTPAQAVLIDIEQPGAAGQRDSHFLDLTGTSFDTVGHDADWRMFVDVNANSGQSQFTWQSRIDAAAFTTRSTLTDGGVFESIELLENGNIVPNSTDNLGFFASTTSSQLNTVISDNTGSGALVFGTSPVISTSLSSDAADPADTGFLRLGNAELLAWETATPGTDVTLGVNSSDRLNASFPAIARFELQAGGTSGSQIRLRGDGNRTMIGVNAADVAQSQVLLGVSSTSLAGPTLTGDDLYLTADANGILLAGTAGGSPTASGRIDYDSTSNTLEYGENGTNRTVANLLGAQTFQNKNFDEANNSIILSHFIEYAAAGCQAGTGFSGFTWDSTDAPASVNCIDGTNVDSGSVTFADSVTDRVHGSFSLPPDWTGNIDLFGYWRSPTASTNIVRWTIQTICVADAETMDPAWNAAQNIDDAGKGTANQVNSFSLTNLTQTTCAANEMFFWRFSRIGGDAADTFAGNADLLKLRFRIRRDH